MLPVLNYHNILGLFHDPNGPVIEAITSAANG